MANRKKLGLACAAAMAICFSASPSLAATVNFATGYDKADVLHTSDNAEDGHWTYAMPGTTSPFGATGHAVVMTSTDQNWGMGGWFANGPTSSWIAVNPDNRNANGMFKMSYSFDMTGLDLSTATFENLKWTIDDAGEVQLNGHTISTLGTGHWGSFLDILVPNSVLASYLLPGENLLQIIMTSTDYSIEGARFEGTLSASNVPLPAALPLLGSGLAALGIAKRRRKAA